MFVIKAADRFRKYIEVQHGESYMERYTHELTSALRKGILSEFPTKKKWLLGSGVVRKDCSSSRMSQEINLFVAASRSASDGGVSR